MKESYQNIFKNFYEEEKYIKDSINRILEPIGVRCLRSDGGTRLICLIFWGNIFHNLYHILMGHLRLPHLH